MKGFIQRIIKIENQEFRIYVKEVDPSLPFILFVPGFRSLAINAELLLNDLGGNCITFDFPGIESNSAIKRFADFGFATDKIVDLVIEEILKVYEVKTLICASLTTPYVLYKYHLRKDMNIFLLSPQFKTSLIDYVLLYYCKFSLLLHKLLKKNVYRYLDRVLLAKVWMGILDSQTSNPYTTEILKKDLESSVSPWTENQFITFFKYKKKSVLLLSELKDISNIYILIGTKDPIVEESVIRSYVNHIEKKNIIIMEYNHILETEATKEIAKLYNSII